MGPPVGKKMFFRRSVTARPVEPENGVYKEQRSCARSLDQSGRASTSSLDTRDPQENR